MDRPAAIGQALSAALSSGLEMLQRSQSGKLPRYRWYRRTLLGTRTCRYGQRSIPCQPRSMSAIQRLHAHTRARTHARRAARQERACSSDDSDASSARTVGSSYHLSTPVCVCVCVRVCVCVCVCVPVCV